MGVHRVYEESISNLPAVGVPDWDLLDKLGDLLRPYGRAGFEYQVQDARGKYAAANTANLRREIEGRSTPLRTISVLSYGEDGTWMTVYMSPGWLGFGATVKSSEEQVKNHVAARIRELFADHALPDLPDSETGSPSVVPSGRGRVRELFFDRREQPRWERCGLALFAALALIAATALSVWLAGGGESGTVEPAPPASPEAAPKPERDPTEGEKLLGQFSSVKFFGGALIVFATRIVDDRYGDITIQSLRIEAEDLSIACSHTGVRVGSAPSVRTPTQRLYTVSIGALRAGVAEVAAYRMYDPGRIGCGVASIEGIEP